MTRGNENFLSSRVITISLMAILLAGLVLRVWGIWFGLPFLFHNDEGFEVIRALQLGTGEFDFTRITKGGYFYLLFVEYGILFVVLFLSGVISSPNEFGELYLKDPSAFYLVGRATTALIGCATIYFVFRIGRVSYSALVGLIAAALLAVNVLHAYLSHFVTVDVPMACLATASLLFAARIAGGGQVKDYWWAAALAALATTTKIPAALLIVPLLIAHFYKVRSDAGDSRSFFGRKEFWQAGAIFLGLYLALTPGMFLYGGDLIWHLLAKFGIGPAPLPDLAAQEAGLELDERAMAANTNLFVFYLDVLVESMTWPVFILCMAGLVYALWRRTPADIVLASFPIVTYLAVSTTTDVHQFFPRYMLPAIPVLVLFGARLLGTVVLSLSRQQAIGVATALTVVLSAWPAGRIAESNDQMLQEDTRAIARRWFDENIPENSMVFIEGHRTTLAKATIPLQNSAENIRDSIDFYTGNEPGRVKYFRTLLKVQEGKTFNLVGVSSWELEDLAYYKRMGVQYFVLRPQAYPGSRTQFAWEDLVEAIRADPDIELIKRFDPGPESRTGPLLEIYRVNSNVADAAVVSGS